MSADNLRAEASIAMGTAARPGGESATMPREHLLPRRWRWLGPVFVVVVLSVVGFGGFLVDIPLDDLTTKPVMVGGHVRVVPLSGWHVVRRPGSKGAASIVLTRGGGNLQIVTGRFRGDSKELLAAFLHGVVQPQTSQLAVSQAVQRVKLNSGLKGVRVDYVGSTAGASIEGQVAAVVSGNGTAVVFNAWAPEGLFPYEAGDVDRMVATTEVRS